MRSLLRRWETKTRQRASPPPSARPCTARARARPRTSARCRRRRALYWLMFSRRRAYSIISSPLVIADWPLKPNALMSHSLIASCAPIKIPVCARYVIDHSCSLLVLMPCVQGNRTSVSRDHCLLQDLGYDPLEGLMCSLRRALTNSSSRSLPVTRGGHGYGLRASGYLVPDYIPLLAYVAPITYLGYPC